MAVSKPIYYVSVNNQRALHMLVNGGLIEHMDERVYLKNSSYIRDVIDKIKSFRIQVFSGWYSGSNL